MTGKRTAVKFLEGFDADGAKMALDFVVAPDAKGDGTDQPISYEEIDNLLRWHPLIRLLYDALTELSRADILRILRRKAKPES